MKNNSPEKLKAVIEAVISETIEELLMEDGDYDYGSPSDTMGGIYNQSMNSGPGGSHGYGDPGGKTAGQVVSSLAGILPLGIVPRVGNTLLWGVENMTSRVIGLLKTLYTYFTKAFFPGFETINDYETIRQDEATNLAKIDAKYAETLKMNLAVLHDLDAWGIVFLLDPSLGLGWRLLEKAPSAAISVANALTGGRISDVVKHAIEQRGMTVGDFGGDASVKGMLAQLGMTDFNLAESSAEGGDGKAGMKELKAVLKTVFSSKKFLSAVASGGVAKKIQTFAMQSILQRAKLILSKKTLEELGSVSEVSAATQQALAAIKQQSVAGRFSPQEIEQMKQGALGQLKEQFKKIASANLTKEAQKDPKISGLVGQIIKQIQGM